MRQIVGRYVQTASYILGLYGVTLGYWLATRFDAAHTIEIFGSFFSSQCLPQLSKRLANSLWSAFQKNDEERWSF